MSDTVVDSSVVAKWILPETDSETATPPPKAMKRELYWEMTTDELAEAAKQFDQPFVADQSRPLTPAERKQWNQMRRKRGRPRVGLGCKRVSVSLEQGLLKRVTALAKKRRISRSKLFSQVLQEALRQDQ